jgi:ubiquinone/menaquinone biosynthesis C-methylase UbiE
MKICFFGEMGVLKTSTESRTFDVVEWKLRLSDPWYKLVMKMLMWVIPDFGEKKILEVGCGIGGFCINAASKGADVVGVDVASKAVHEGKNLARRFGVQERIDFIIADAHYLPFKDNTMEIVVCSETLEHVSDYKKAFSELVRATQKSGYLCLTVPNLLSSLFFEYIVLRLLGQPQYVKRHVCVEKEDIFHVFKLRQLLNREDLKVMKIQSTNFLHVPPRVKSTLKICRNLQIISDRIEDYFEAHNLPVRLLGANLGVLARKI